MSDNDEVDIADRDKNFDSTLTTSHSYLGNNFEVTRGRTLLDNGICVNLPLLLENSIVLFPGHTLPMVKYRGPVIDHLRSCIDKDKTFGVVLFARGDKLPGRIGTTAEIYEYSDSAEEGFRIKAKGRQRFKILQIRTERNAVFADVRILPEIELGPPCYEVRHVSLDRLRSIPKTEEEARKLEYKVGRRDSALTPWPSWVYRQYDACRLTIEIRESLQFVQSRGTNIPQDPVELSFWVAHNLVMSDATKLMLLQKDCAISRLQYETKLVSKLFDKSFACSRCRSPVGRHRDIVSMNKESLQAAYCNPGGAVHETITLYRVTNVSLSREPPSIEASWFPGYGWTIAFCSNCRNHLGWLFTAMTEGLRPKRFWGLTRKSLVIHGSDDNSDSDSVSVDMENDRTIPIYEEEDLRALLH